MGFSGDYGKCGFALLQRGVNLLDNQGDVRITVANEVLETLAPAKTIVPGLGYIKKTFTDKKVVDARKITVENGMPVSPGEQSMHSIRKISIK